MDPVEMTASTTRSPAPQLSPPERLLCGPGPTNVEPSVLDAMREPMLGHLDPALHELLLELVGMLRAVYGVEDGIALPLQATGMSGMETGIVNLVSPGDVVIVGYAGFFGRRIAQMAARHGAEVVEVTRDWGEVVPTDALLEALHRRPEARLLAVVHAETSTGAQYPLQELGAALKGSDTLLLADCVTSLGGIPLAFGEWGVDFAYSCTQKALGAPPGMSPIACSERALERIRAREHAVPFSFDIELLLDYWVERPVTYHHTAPILHIYALYQALRHTLEEGLAARWERHERAGRHLQAAIRERGLDLLADPDHQLPHLTAVRVPEGVDGKRVQQRLLDEHGIEVGGGLGPDSPEMWRIGLMGPNASIEVADRVLEAFDTVLAGEPAATRAT
jgi:alanine-glyoxylate transaminase/serine-glyoxylate transaminase/serine-pyruvate transaminase